MRTVTIPYEVTMNTRCSNFETKKTMKSGGPELMKENNLLTREILKIF